MIYASGLWPSRSPHPHTDFVDNFVQKSVCHHRQAAPAQRFDTLMTIAAEKFPMKSMHLDTNTRLSEGPAAEPLHAATVWSIYMRPNVTTARAHLD
jgi:hypothetical protein